MDDFPIHVTQHLLYVRKMPYSYLQALLPENMTTLHLQIRTTVARVKESASSMALQPLVEHMLNQAF